MDVFGVFMDVTTERNTEREKKKKEGEDKEQRTRVSSYPVSVWDQEALGQRGSSARLFMHQIRLRGLQVKQRGTSFHDSQLLLSNALRRSQMTTHRPSLKT